MNDHTTALRPLFGLPGEDLTGPESRALRTALNLERRHVLALSNALGLADGVTTADRVTLWEKSKGRGYPAPLVDVLNRLEHAVDALAEHLRLSGEVAVNVVTLRKPLGHKNIHQLLDTGQFGLSFREGELRMLDDGGGDFWHALADAAIARAAVLMARRNFHVRVVMDREPDGPVSPPA